MAVGEEEESPRKRFLTILPRGILTHRLGQGHPRAVPSVNTRPRKNHLLTNSHVSPGYLSTGGVLL